MPVSRSSSITESALRREFMRTFDATAPHPLAELAVFVPSTEETENYQSLGDAPEMREHKDSSEVEGLPDLDYALQNKQFHAVLEISKHAIDFDKRGHIDMKVADMAKRARMFPGKLISDLILNGATTGYNGYDAVSFFNNTHPAKGNRSTIDNILSTAGQTVANLKTDLNSAIAYFLAVKDTQNVPLNDGMPLDLVAVIPAALEAAYREMIGADIISQTTNVNKGRARYIVNARMDATSTTAYYYFNVSGNRKPFVLQESSPVTTNMTKEDDSDYILNLRKFFTANWVGNAGYFWFESAVKFA